MISDHEAGASFDKDKALSLCASLRKELRKARELPPEKLLTEKLGMCCWYITEFFMSFQDHFSTPCDEFTAIVKKEFKPLHDYALGLHNIALRPAKDVAAPTGSWGVIVRELPSSVQLRDTSSKSLHRSQDILNKFLKNDRSVEWLVREYIKSNEHGKALLEGYH